MYIELLNDFENIANESSPEELEQFATAILAGLDKVAGNTIKGLGIGAAAGAGLGLGLNRSSKRQALSDKDRNKAVAGLAAGGAGLGMVGGTLIDSAKDNKNFDDMLKGMAPSTETVKDVLDEMSVEKVIKNMKPLKYV